MEDFMVLVKEGVIYDGCPIVAKGTVRIKDGDVSIESMHNMMAVNGYNFGELCDSKGRSSAKQGQLLDHCNFDEDFIFEDWKAKAAELATQKEALVEEMKNNMDLLQDKLQRECAMRAASEENLAREQRISDEASHAILDLKSKLANKAEEVDVMRSKLEIVENMLVDREGTTQDLQLEIDNMQTALETKAGQVQDLQAQLDSQGMILGEKDEKLRTLKQQMTGQEDQVRAMELREQEQTQQLEELRYQISNLEEAQAKDKSIAEELSEYRNNSENEMRSLREELEHYKTTIATLKNELELAQIEDNEYQQTITDMRKESASLKNELEAFQASHPQEHEKEKVSRRLKAQQSFKVLISKITPPTDKSAQQTTPTKEKKEKKDKKRKEKDDDKSDSVALPAM